MDPLADFARPIVLTALNSVPSHLSSRPCLAVPGPRYQIASSHSCLVLCFRCIQSFCEVEKYRHSTESVSQSLGWDAHALPQMTSPILCSTHTYLETPCTIAD